jgi:hypothetical protein
MQTELQGRERPAKEPEQPVKKPTAQRNEYTVDICAVGYAAFHTNLKHSENTLFSLSLYELDRELEDRKQEQKTELDIMDQQPNETELQWLRRILPPELKEFADVFSKMASNKLPPHRPYDHKIQLEDPESTSSIGYSPLRHQSTQELEEIKRFLDENLHRGFIESSQAPFASPILFVKKANGSLRFCVDFRRLNNLTRKD